LTDRHSKAAATPIAPAMSARDLGDDHGDEHRGQDAAQDLEAVAVREVQRAAPLDLAGVTVLADLESSECRRIRLLATPCARCPGGNGAGHDEDPQRTHPLPA